MVTITTADLRMPQIGCGYLPGVATRQWWMGFGIAGSIAIAIGAVTTTGKLQ